MKENSFEWLKSLLIHDRSTRIFDATRPVGREMLVQMISLLPYCASGRNLQPLKYRLVHKPEECEAIYATLKWAGYYSDWDGPSPNHRPTAYLVQCLDTELTTNCLCDDGLHLQTLTLGATTLGLSGCIIKAFDAAALRSALSLAPRFNPLYILALGYGEEKIIIERLNPEIKDAHKYHRLADGTHVVPKRDAESLII